MAGTPAFTPLAADGFGPLSPARHPTASADDARPSVASTRVRVVGRPLYNAERITITHGRIGSVAAAARVLYCTHRLVSGRNWCPHRGRARDRPRHTFRDYSGTESSLQPYISCCTRSVIWLCGYIFASSSNAIVLSVKSRILTPTHNNIVHYENIFGLIARVQYPQCCCANNNFQLS